MPSINFDDSQLQQHCEKVVLAITTLPEELRPICALLDAWHWFRLTEGEQSPRVSEAIRHLADPQMRPALKSWYLKTSNLNVAADEFRRILEQAAGEELPLGRK
jgi:hypothetical protein